jgi:cytosine/adenosine deaminase-related metal-dependent hydrolase
MGVNTAIGIDEAGINDDRDMLQEMRLVLRAHRTPGHNPADVPTMAQVLRMATAGGARTTPYGDRIGTLEAGKAADLTLIDWRAVAYPYLDEETGVLDAVIQRAKTAAVKLVMCDGDVIYKDGVFTHVDRDGALKSLHDQLAQALSPDDAQRRRLGKALMPHVKKFYENYLPAQDHEPFYRPNQRR